MSPLKLAFAWSVVAQAVPAEESVFKWITGLGTVGVLLTIIWFVFQRLIPTMQARYEDLLTKAQDQNIAQAKEFHETLRAIVEKHAENENKSSLALADVKSVIEKQTITLASAIRENKGANP